MYVPSTYWSRRAKDLIRTYDRPGTWPGRGWMRAGVEEDVVPRLLADAEVVFVPGAGSGRQYGYLLEAGFEPWGIDIAPRLVKECRRRYPSVQTLCASVVGAEELEGSDSDAAVTSAVLQHIPPNQIVRAVGSLKTIASEVIVIREQTRLVIPSPYQFAHDYDTLFADWEQVYREVTDETDAAIVELIAWRR